MDIIDEEGNVFGLVNLIDALVVLIVLALVVAGWSLVSRPGGEGVTEDTVVINLTVEEVQPYIADELDAGDGPDDFRILDESASPARVVIEDREGELHVREHPLLLTVRLRAEIRIQRGPAGMQFRGEALRVGREITVDTGRVVVTGTVTDILEGSPP